MPLLPYQKAWLRDLSPIKVWEKSWRIGATYSEAYDAMRQAVKTNGCDFYYASYSQAMATEYIETAADWARRYNAKASAIEQIALADEDKDILAFRIRFGSGHKIVALSSRPANFRGKQGVAVIDEAAHHPDLDGLLKAAIAMTMWGGKVHILSTHFGAENPFNRLVEDIRAGRRAYSLHRTTLDDALDQGLYQAICQTLHEPWSAEREVRWRQTLLEDYGDAAE